ncbi:MAG: hypothetical protein ABIH66_11140 [bacterium]
MNQPLLVLFLTGFFFNYFNYSYIRLVGTKLPLSLYAPVVLCLGLAGAAMGAYLSRRLSERMAGLLEAACCASAAIFFLAACANVNVPTQYLNTGADLPILQQPTFVWLRLVGELATFMLGHGVYVLLGFHFAKAFERVAVPSTSYAVHLAGFALGLIAAHMLVPAIGALPAIALLLAATVVLLRRKRIAFLFVPVVAASLFVSTRMPPTFLTWSVGEYEWLESRWTKNYKLDFISFDDGRCIAGVFNNSLLDYTCPGAERDYYARRKLFEAVAPGRDDVLIVGAGMGMAAQSVVAANPAVRSVLVLDIEPEVVEAAAGRHAAFSGDVYGRQNVDILAAESRAFAERESDRYDLIYVSNIDNLQLFLYGSSLPIESFNFTREGYGRYMRGLLKPDGVFIFAGGYSGTVIDEVYPFLANIPEDFSRRLFWYVIADSPFVGMPMFLIIASRDEEALEGYARVLSVDSGMLSIELPRGRSLRITDDHPIVYLRTMRVFTIVMLGFFSIGFLVLIFGVGGVVRSGVERFAPLCFMVLLGCGYSVLQAFLLLGNVTLFLDPVPAVAHLLVVFVAGAGLANVVFSEGGAGWRSPAVLWALALLVGAACAGSVYLVDQPAAVVASVLLSGFLAGFFWPAGLTLFSAEKRAVAYAFHGFGAVLGLLMFQLAYLVVGFTAAAALAAALFILLPVVWGLAGKASPA